MSSGIEPILAREGKGGVASELDPDSDEPPRPGSWALSSLVGEVMTEGMRVEESERLLLVVWTRSRAGDFGGGEKDDFAAGLIPPPSGLGV